MQRRYLSRVRAALGLLAQPAMQPAGDVDQQLPQRRAPEVRGKFPVDQQGAPVVRFPLTVRGRQLLALLRPHGELSAVALCAHAYVAFRIESKIVTAWDVAQPSFLDLEFFRSGTQRN